MAAGVCGWNRMLGVLRSEEKAAASQAVQLGEKSIVLARSDPIQSESELARRAKPLTGCASTVAHSCCQSSESRGLWSYAAIKKRSGSRRNGPRVARVPEHEGEGG